MARFSTRTRLLLIALLLAAWAWRLHSLDGQSLWRDEVDSLRFATRPLAQVLGNFTRPGENGPLFFLALRPWLTASGTTEFALRFPSVLLGLLALPLVFVWGRRLFGLSIALLATLLMAVNPYHLWYSQEAKMYALLVVVAMLAMWAFVQAIERGKWWRWVVWLLLISVGFYVHVMAVLLVPLQIGWLLLNPRWRRRWRSFGLALLVLILPYVPLVWWQWKLFADPNFSTGHRFAPLTELLQRLVQAQIQGIPPRPNALLFAAPIFLLLAAIFLSKRFRLARQLTLLWWLLPALGIFFISLQVPIFLDRYLIFTLPALVLLLAAGAWLVGRENRWLAGLLVLLLVSFQLWQGWQQTSRPWKADFRAAAAYVQPRRLPDDLTFFSFPTSVSTTSITIPRLIPGKKRPMPTAIPMPPNCPSAWPTCCKGTRACGWWKARPISTTGMD